MRTTACGRVVLRRRPRRSSPHHLSSGRRGRFPRARPRVPPRGLGSRRALRGLRQSPPGRQLPDRLHASLPASHHGRSGRAGQTSTGSAPQRARCGIRVDGRKRGPSRPARPATGSASAASTGLRRSTSTVSSSATLRVTRPGRCRARRSSSTGRRVAGEACDSSCSSIRGSSRKTRSGSCSRRSARKRRDSHASTRSARTSRQHLREFTFKDVSPAALDAFESFFNSR